MAIRVVKDDDSQEGNQQPGRRNTGGGGLGGLIQFLPFLIGVFGKRPKLLILLIVIGAAYYFFKGGFNSIVPSQNKSSLSTGAQLDPEKFDNTEVFESLEYGINNLPERVTLEQYCPPRLNQGQQGSCVAWSHSYAAHSILFNRKTGTQPSANNAFSPSFLYNQIKLDGCQGSYIPRAMEKMMNQGSVPFSDFSYDEQDCSRQPSENLVDKASNFKIKGFQRLTKGDKNGFESEEIDLLAIKQYLAQGAPVTIGMMVGGSFMQGMVGKEIWFPTESDYDMNGFGGHAMCLIGYDDYKAGGAFQIMNSWGNEWGKNGIAWVRYKDFEFFNKEAYGIYPMGSANEKKFAAGQLKASFGLLNKDNNQLINLNKTSNFSFRTNESLKKGLSKFKIQVTNDAECYTYVMGLENDNKTIKGLFPYTEKHSPYCGIMGIRLFPKDYSLQPDEQGNLDYFVILVSKKPLAYQELITKMTSLNGNLEQKVKTLFGNQLIIPNFTNTNQINFEVSNADDNSVIAMIIEVKKN